jgi:hypothetical protein
MQWSKVSLFLATIVARASSLDVCIPGQSCLEEGHFAFVQRQVSLLKGAEIASAAHDLSALDDVATGGGMKRGGGGREVERRGSVKHGYEVHAYVLDRSMSTSSLAAGDKQPPEVLFTHLLKAGGTRIKDLLEEVFNFPSHGALKVKQSEVGSPSSSIGKNVEEKLLANIYGEELTGIPSKTHSNFFRIGSVRSPCDYLLSMWAFQSTPNYLDQVRQNDFGHGRWPRECLIKTDPDAETNLYGQDIDGNLSTAADIDRFRKWIRVSSGTRLHYTSLRSFFALHYETPDKKVKEQQWDDGQYFGCLGDINATEQERIADVLAKTNLSDRYECLIHTESLEPELHQCLIKYADLLTDHQQRATFLDKVDKVFSEKVLKQPIKRNPSVHAKCRDYFDDDTAAFVWERDGSFASRVGYKTCCAE